MDSIALKRLKSDLPRHVDAALDQHALKANRWATRARIALGVITFIAAWVYPATPEIDPVLGVIAAAWIALALAAHFLTRNNSSDSLVRTTTLLDFTVLHVGLIAGTRLESSGFLLLLFCYFPLLAIVSMRYRRSLVLICAIYTAAVLIGFGFAINPTFWFILAIFELAAVISFFSSGKPKDAVVGVAAKSLQEAFETGAKQKEIELNNLFHEVFFPAAQVDLPSIWSSSKHRAGTDLGGDYYHIFETERGPLVIVGDISGSGFEASRDVAQLHQQLTKIVNGETELMTILDSLNSWLYEKYAGKRRFTCVLARWESENLHYANADHLPVVRLSIKQERSQLPITSGPLGEKPEANFVVEEIPFQPREMIMIYTDGLYKKITSDRQQGIAQIESLVDQFNHGEINTICHRVFDCAQPGLEEPPDDATLVVIRRQPKAAEESKAQTGGKA
jgi:hypothetical protein